MDSVVGRMTNDKRPQGRPKKDKGKVRQNVSFSPDVVEMLRIKAEEEDTTMSALLNQWAREKCSPPPASKKSRLKSLSPPEGKSSDSRSA